VRSRMTWPMLWTWGMKELAKLRKELRVSGLADVVKAGRPSGQLEDEA